MKRQKKQTKKLRRCILKDCCTIADNTILAEDSVVPPFTIFSGSPGTPQGELSECFQELQRQKTVAFYESMVLRPKASN